MRTAAREMSTVRRLGKDESGMTLGLTMVMIVLIGVMGAGLLTFVSTDLGTVLEVNRGQRAFEVAEAGIEVAKHQLTDDCSSGNNCIDNYDDPSVPGTQDSLWRKARGGVTLNDLDGEFGTEDNSVHVTIDYSYVKQEFKVVATGKYGVAKRKIEATFRGISDVLGGSGLGHPTYYTPSDIQIELPLKLSGMSLFTEKDILFRDVETVSEFRTLNATSSNEFNSLHIPNPPDNLSNWKSDDFTGGNRGWWNTRARIGPNGRLNPPYRQPGFAALGKIHCYTDSLTNTACDPNVSIADGVYGYDSTTGERISSIPGACPTSTDPLNTTKPLADRGNNWTFCEKPAADIAARRDNAPGTISFPFPRPIPNAQLLRGYAVETDTYWGWGDGGSTTPPWDTFFPDAARDNKVVFIDAEGNDITFNPSNPNKTYKGILVVWCGNLQMNAKFSGIILNLYPNGSVGSELPGGSTCTNDYGVYRNNAQTMSGWVYAQGGNDDQAGIVFGAGSTMEDLTPANEWSFFNDAFTGAPPTGVQAKGWRELYE